MRAVVQSWLFVSLDWLEAWCRSRDCRLCDSCCRLRQRGGAAKSRCTFDPSRDSCFFIPVHMLPLRRNCYRLVYPHKCALLSFRWCTIINITASLLTSSMCSQHIWSMRLTLLGVSIFVDLQWCASQPVTSALAPSAQSHGGEEVLKSDIAKAFHSWISITRMRVSWPLGRRLRDVRPYVELSLHLPRVHGL